MRWTWDPDKAAANRVKHGLSFETAVLAFDDPLHASKPDPHRVIASPRVSPSASPRVNSAKQSQPLARATEIASSRFALLAMTSARKATAHERRMHEEGSS